MDATFLATLIASLFFLASSEVIQQASQDSDKHNNAVEAKVYMYSDDMWNTGGSSTLVNSMAEKANSHCEQNFQECCLFQNWTSSSIKFSSSDVSTDFAGYPMTKRPYTNTKIGVTIPSGLSSFIDLSCGNHSYIKKATVIKLMEQSRSTFSDKTDHYIVEIEEKRYPLPPNNLINYIMIPISIALVVIFIVLLIILMWKCGKVHKQYSKRSGPPEPVFKLEQITATNSVTTTMTPTAVEVQMEPPGNNSNAPPGVKNEQQQNPQQAQAVENGNTKKELEENKELIGKDKEYNPQHNSGYDPAPTDEALDDIEKELANIN